MTALYDDIFIPGNMILTGSRFSLWSIMSIAAASPASGAGKALVSAFSLASDAKRDELLKSGPGFPGGVAFQTCGLEKSAKRNILTDWKKSSDGTPVCSAGRPEEEEVFAGA